MAYGTLKVRKDGPVQTVTLSRPEVFNAFDPKMIEELTTEFGRVGDEKNVRVVVLAGEGKHFCAGADISWMKSTIDYSKEQNEVDTMKIHQMLETIYMCSKPTIGRVQGVAFGGAVGLLSCVDVAIGASDSKFSISEVRLGILPAAISPYISRKIGVAGLRAYGLSAKRFDAVTAQRIGLLQEVVKPNELDAAVGRWVDEFCQNGAEGMALLKGLSEKVRAASFSEAAQHTTKTIAEARVGEEGQEGLRAFLEKREPSWRGK